MKCEPAAYRIDDLARDGKAPWEGVRNYQARNYLRAMAVGDWALFYQSNANPSGVVGLMRICAAAYPDHFAFNPESRYFDPASTQESPRWFMVDVCFVERFDRVISLAELKNEPLLAGMNVVKKGQRLSVMPESREHFLQVLTLAGSSTPLE